MQVIGNDMAKATFDVALPLSEGKYRTKAKFPNTTKGYAEFLAWRAKHAPDAAVGMEATGIYHEALARALVEAGVVVYVANPARVKAFGQAEGVRTKTDRSDAKLIARFFEAQRPEKLHPYVPPTPSEVKLRALVRRRDDLQEMLQMEQNRLEVADISVQQGINDVIRTLEEQIRQVRKAIQDHIDNDPDLRGRHQLLTSIPGVGDTSSAQLLAFLGDLNRYSDVRQVVAHAGLNPAQRQSGNYEGKARISRVGDANFRKKLYMPALTGKAYNPTLKAFAERLSKKGKPFKVIMCALMRKLIHLVWGVLKSGRPFEPEVVLA
ncbi:IS110 family transposase [Stenotrophomonas maltophilia]|uniref:IS110 family transposase n=1 Tax=Stenotrophomonas maltophilia TaxID=40324 RepID=UPI0039F7142F